MEPLSPDDPRKVGPYQIVARLGSGGMGRVYLARSPGNRQVAVKVIRPDLAQEYDFRRRFAREVAASRSVSGLFTAGVVDADPTGTPPWLATAYIPGPSLHDAVAASGALPERSVRALGVGLVEALAAIHRADVVHRDLKPGNVLLAQDGPRVIDFGISRVGAASVLTEVGTTMGSPGYISPEQIQGGRVGPPTDVFSLGAVLAFAATGNGPFGVGSVPVILYRIVHEPPDLGDVPPGLRQVIASCLDKDPECRPTLGELAHALGEGRAVTELFVPGWLPRTVPPGTMDPRAILARGPAAASAASAASSVQHASVLEAPAPTPAEPDLADAAPERPRAGPSRRQLLLASGGLAASAALGYAGLRFLRPENEPSGTRLWRFPTTGTLVNYPRVAGDLVYAASNDGTLYAVDVGSGEQRWAYTTDAALGSAPFILGGVAYLGSDDGKLYALDAESGRRRWTFATGGIVHSPVVTGGVAYIGSADGYLYAVKVDDGGRLWRFRTGNDTHSPVVAGETVYVGCSDTNLYAVDAHAGTVRWKFTTAGAVSWFPAVDAGLVFFTSTDGKLYAVEATSGKLVWKADGVAAQAGPVVARGMVFAGGGRRLHAWDAAGGEHRWTLGTEGDVSAPAVSDGVVYVGSSDQFLYAVDAGSGKARWKHTAAASVHPPAVTTGAVYFGGSDNNLYSVRI